VHGGYPGDNGDYQGHVTAIDLTTGAQRAFNAMCSDQAVHFARLPGTPACSAARSAIWARPGVIYDAGTDRIYMATGNGSYNGTAAGNYWSETVFALRPDGSGTGGKPLDSYTPANFQALDNADDDLGSAAPAILPVPASSSVQHLAMQTGKDGKLRLIDLANLSGQGGPGRTGGEIGTIIDCPTRPPALALPVRHRCIASGTTGPTPITATQRTARRASRWSSQVGSPKAMATTP
jgi:hypothetical protein